MNPTLIDALSTLFRLQRWNFLPRVETWIESENVIYSVHLGLPLAKNSKDFPNNLLPHFIARCILKPLNKHFLTDVSYRVKLALNSLLKKENKEEDSAWEIMVDETAKKESCKLFSRRIKADLLPYMLGIPKEGELQTEEWEKIENLCKYVQLRTALQECETNFKVYQGYYKEYVVEIEDRIKNLCKNGEKASLFKQFDDAFETHNEPPKAAKNDDVKRFPGYFGVIRNLKYLRRWNRINRSVESSVLGHTYLVTLLTFIFLKMHSDFIKKYEIDEEKAILRALFHDVSEALTGDIISPVKSKIEEVLEIKWQDVERKVSHEFIQYIIPEQSHLKETIMPLGTNGLLEKLDDSEHYSDLSLVKDCDRMALVIECIFEKMAGSLAEEMASVYNDYLEDLQNSEWPYIREFSARLIIRYP